MPNPKREQEAPGRDTKDNVVDMRLAKPTEPRLQFLFELTKEDESFWGLSEDLSNYKTNLDVAYKLLGCQPSDISDWSKVISQYVPEGYLKQGGRFTKQGLIELFQFQWCCSPTVVARGEDWDVLVAINATNGIQPTHSKREVLRDSKNRAVLIPNLHPAEFEAALKGRVLSAEQIEGARAKVKLNNYKVGYVRYIELLQLRWDEYQQQALDEEVINLDFSSSNPSGNTGGTLARYDASTNGNRNSYQDYGQDIGDVSDLIPIEEMSSVISSFQESGDGFQKLVRKLKAERFKEGRKSGAEIEWARVAGLHHGMEEVQKSTSEMFE